MSLVNLLSAGPGTFVYHFLIFMVLEAVVGILLVEYRRNRTPGQRRLLWTFGGLMGMRVLLLFGEPFGSDVSAPIFNGVELASLTLLGWTFLAPSLSPRAGKGYLFVGLGVTLVCVLTFLPGWYEMLARFPHLLYLLFWQQTFWYGVSALMVLTPTLLLLRLQRRGGRQLSLVAFCILSLGFGTLCSASLLLTLGWLGMAAYTLIGLGRLINMLGYPLFAVVVHQAALRDTQARGGAVRGARQAPDLQFLSQASQADGQVLDLDDFLNRAAKGTAVALDADLCAIFLLRPGEDAPGIISLAARYTSFQRAERPLSSFTFLLAEQPALAYALRQRKQLSFNVETDDPRLQTLYRMLGSQRVGPAIIQPIFDQRQVMGAMVVGNNHSQRTFGPDAIRACRNIAVQVAAVLSST